jgi:hypothetical protein
MLEFLKNMHNFQIRTAYLMHSKQQFYRHATIVMPWVLEFGYDGYISIVLRFGSTGGWCLTSEYQSRVSLRPWYRQLGPPNVSPFGGAVKASSFPCWSPSNVAVDLRPTEEQASVGLAPDWGTGIMLAHEAWLSADAQGAVGSQSPQLMNASAPTPKTYTMRMCFALAHRHGKYTKAIMSEGGGGGDGLRCRALVCRIHVRSSSQPQAGDKQRWNLSAKLCSDAWHNQHDTDTHRPTTSWGDQPRRLIN